MSASRAPSPSRTRRSCASSREQRAAARAAVRGDPEDRPAARRRLRDGASRRARIAAVAPRCYGPLHLAVDLSPAPAFGQVMYREIETMRFGIGALAAAACAACVLIVAGPALTSGPSTAPRASAPTSTASASAWTARDLKGTVRLVGQVPLRSQREQRAVPASASARGADDAQLRLPAPRQGGARPTDRAGGEDPPAT